MKTSQLLLLSVFFAVLVSSCVDPQQATEPTPILPPDTIKPFAAIGNILLNEACVANSGMIEDEDFDDPDWIELYNKGDSAVNLKGYSLSDDTSNFALWSFESLTIAPKSYLLVFASGKDRRTVPEKPADDSIRVLAFDSWADTMDIGRSTVHPYGTPRILSTDSSGHWQIRATFNLVDNRPDLGWSAAHITIKFKRSRADLENDYSMYSTLELMMTVPENKKLAIRFLQNTMPYEKGPIKIITGTGKVDEIYRLTLTQGEGGLDLASLSGIRIAPPDYDFGTLSVILRRITAVANRDNLHTSFKLSGEECGLFLSDPAGTLCDSVPLSPLPENMTQGRCNDKWEILAQASPGAENVTQSFRRLVAAPTIANKGGFYKGPVKVSLARSDSASIYYTLDGSVPSAATGKKYTGPIEIAATSVVRCMAGDSGAAPSKVQTASYFIDEAVRLPVISLSTDSQYLFNPDTGIYMKGPEAGDSFPYFGANFWQEKEVPVHCELYETDGTCTFSTGAGLCIAGNWSKGMDKKSLQLNFREAYGASELKAAVFPDRPKLKKFKKLILRNGGGSYNGAIICNSMMMALVDDRNIDYQKNRPVVVYINGHYFGIHFLMEPSNHDYVYTEYDLEKEEIDFYDRGELIKWGTPANWMRMLDLLESSAGTGCDREIADSAYALLYKEIDVHNFIDYNAFEIYIGNTDWPANNNRRWRALGSGGRWRWLIYDLDAGFGGFGCVDSGELVSFNALAFALDTSHAKEFWPNGDMYTYTLRALLRSPTFREDFVNRFATLLATNFAPQRVEQVIDSLVGLIREEVPSDFKRWDYEVKEWEKGVGDLKAYAHDRASYVYRHLAAQFGLDSTFTLTINAAPGSVTVNGMPILESSFTGTYFTGVPVTLSTTNGRALEAWGDGNSDNPRRLTGSGKVTLKPEID